VLEQLEDASVLYRSMSLGAALAGSGPAASIYPVSVGSFAFSHPAMPSGITKALA